MYFANICKASGPACSRFRTSDRHGGSLLLTPVLQSLLIDLPASDSITFGAVAVTLVALALVASYVPARRATRIDPIATLRTE